MKRPSFKAGDTVLHKRFGLGVIVDQWGAIPFTDETGKQILKAGEPLTIDCSKIYDVRFGDQARCRSTGTDEIKRFEVSVKRPELEG